jgi:hypothetical protein
LVPETQQPETRNSKTQNPGTYLSERDIDHRIEEDNVEKKRAA